MASLSRFNCASLAIVEFLFEVLVDDDARLEITLSIKGEDEADLLIRLGDEDEDELDEDSYVFSVCWCVLFNKFK